MASPSSKTNEDANSTAALFENENDESFAKEMKDKVAAIHEYFDKDKDGFLSFQELRSLQLLTSGDDMDENQFVAVCRVLDCHPTKGISLDALKLTYAADGSNIDKDYATVFPESSSTASSKTKDTTEEKSSDDDDIIEVGEGGVDISPDT
mmetsp:Transcript_147/g.242  ORF Transcript_147/g.242 Transcript_147/m.242 type:complete len:151 (-) Transcript_147:39-491(-)